LLRTRVLTGIVLGVIVAVAVFGLETRYAALVFAAFWLVGTDEWARLLRLAGPGRVGYDLVFAAGALAVLAGWVPEGLVAALFTVAAAVWLLMFVFVLRFPKPPPRVATVPVGLIVLLAAWASFHRVHGAGPDGPALIVTGLVIIWSADTGAYFTGRSFGRTPLAPRVSPKKTWEGVAGGVVLATVVGLIAAFALELPLLLLGLTAAAMALISVVGDLGVSMLKRHAGLKDSGVLLPGHGGVMDRFDGVTAALPFFVLGLQFAHVLD
jgi:phosphatidate cytidylyltransferase